MSEVETEPGWIRWSGSRVPARRRGTARRGGRPRGRDELVLGHPSGSPRIACQQWPNPPTRAGRGTATPKQLHLDLTVPDGAEPTIHHERALGLGARLLLDRSDDPDKELLIYAEPDRHPLCIFVASG